MTEKDFTFPSLSCTWNMHNVTNREVSFFRSIFNDRYNKFVVVAVFLPRLPSTDSLDHFLVCDLELLTQVEKSGHHRSFGMSVDDCTSS